jgi:hypothetical protein
MLLGPELARVSARKSALPVSAVARLSSVVVTLVLLMQETFPLDDCIRRASTSNLNSDYTPGPAPDPVVLATSFKVMLPRWNLSRIARTRFSFQVNGLAVSQSIDTLAISSAYCTLHQHPQVLS